MRTAVRILGFSATFSLVVAVVYWFVSYERTGSVLLLFMFLAPLFVATYLGLKAGRARLAQDDAGASHDREAGTALGRFSAGSVWPFVMAIGAAIALQGFIYGVWVLAPGLLLVAWAGLGLMAESRD